MSQRVLHFGGNGHSGCRLERARDALAAVGQMELLDMPYPGFDGRPRVEGFETVLDAISAHVRELNCPVKLAYASGIGALIALALRARGELAGIPLIFQGPVLWGLEHRMFPRLMRFRPARRALARAIQARFAQDRFVRKHFRRPLGPELRRRFFEGYARCEAFEDAFDWFTPAFLRDLERAFRDRPSALDSIRVWVGSGDKVVGLEEVRVTERALGVSWPVTVFEGWGHYPMIDVPEEWAEALRHALVTIGHV